MWKGEKTVMQQVQIQRSKKKKEKCEKQNNDKSETESGRNTSAVYLPSIFVVVSPTPNPT